MSFDKNYPNRKDHRKPFTTEAEKVSQRCRHGGDCPECMGNRTFNAVKTKLQAAQDLTLVDDELEETV